MPITGFVSGTLLAVDPVTLAWVQSVVQGGGTVSNGRKALVDQLVKGLRTDAVWNKLDRMWLLAAENATSARTDIVATQLATVVGSPTFTTDRGYTGTDLNVSAATDYLLTNWAPIPGSQFQQNSAHLSAWSNTNAISTANGGCIAGLSGAAVQTNIFPRYSDGTTKSRCNDGTLDTGAANANSIGHWIANRTGASASQEYLNGSLLRSPNTASAAVVYTGTFIICALDNDPGPPIAAFGSACQITMASMGAGFTSTDATNFYNRLRRYMTAVGVP